jgi:hypothetical protein
MIQYYKFATIIYYSVINSIATVLYILTYLNYTIKIERLNRPVLSIAEDPDPQECPCRKVNCSQRLRDFIKVVFLCARMPAQTAPPVARLVSRAPKAPSSWPKT